MTATAIRNPKRGKAHRKADRYYTRCAKRTITLTETVPLDTVPTDQRCKRCWPEEVGA